jgi:hypothetical protein
MVLLLVFGVVYWYRHTKLGMMVYLISLLLVIIPIRRIWRQFTYVITLTYVNVITSLDCMILLVRLNHEGIHIHSVVKWSLSFFVINGHGHFLICDFGLRLHPKKMWSNL